VSGLDALLPKQLLCGFINYCITVAKPNVGGENLFLKKRVQRDDDRLPTHLKKTGFRIKPWTPCGAGQVRNDKLNKTAAVWKAQKDIKKKARATTEPLNSDFARLPKPCSARQVGEAGISDCGI